MTTKNFDGWNTKKKDTDNRTGPPFFYERELWWCTLGINIGFEQNGSDEEYRRPVLVLKVLSRSTCLVAPLTTSTNQHNLRPTIGLVEGVENHALLSQMRVIDTKRLFIKIGTLDREVFDGIRKTARELL